MKTSLFSAARNCENPESLVTKSVIISGFTSLAVVGTTVNFDCPPGAVFKGYNSSKCMENGEWEPAIDDVNCLGTTV